MEDKELAWLRRKLKELHQSRLFFLRCLKEQYDWFFDEYLPSTRKKDGDEPSTD